MWRDVVGFLLHFSSRVFHRNGQAAGAHGGQIDYIVADERGFFRFETFPAQNVLQAGAFVLNALMNVFQLQVAGTQGHGFGDALGDQAGFDAGSARQRDRRAVVGVKAFGLDESLAVQTEAALSAMRGRLLQDSLLGSGCCGKYEELSVGEDAVDIEEEELDFASPGVSGELWHGRDSSTR